MGPTKIRKDKNMSIALKPGFGVETITTAVKAGVDFKKNGRRLWSQVAASNMEAAIPVINGQTVRKFKEAFPNRAALRNIPEDKLLEALSSGAAYRNKMNGTFYHYCVAETLSRVLSSKGFEVLTEVTVDGFRYDICLYWGEEFSIDLEVSLKASEYQRQYLRHGGKALYFITPGYDLTNARPQYMVDRMLELDIYPVVTVGSPHEGVITFDQMITEIIQAKKDTDPPKVATS
jgi:hypothetical protein